MDKETIEKYRKAGRIAAEALQFGKSLIRPDARVVDICDKVEEKIRSLGGGLAFPAQVSINNIAAHYCPIDNDPLLCQQGDLVKIDVGVHIDGYIGDNALTVDLGDNKELLQASLDALNSALKVLRKGISVSEIGKEIQAAIQLKGFSPIKNLSGHGLDRYKIHTKPTIPNFDNHNTLEIEENMAIAIEPFATNGQGMIFDSSPATIFALENIKPVRSPYAREVLEHIKQYESLPFTLRWVTRALGEGKARFGLRELERFGIISSFPPLPDKGNGLVSQHEKSILILDKPLIITETDE